MSKENLKLYIKEKTEKEVENVLNEAEKSTKTIIEEAKNKVEKIKDDKYKKLLKEMEEKEKAEISLSKMEGKKRIMKVKEEFLDKIFDEVQKKLKNISSKTNESYENTLTSLSIEAIREIGNNEVIISANKNDLDILKNNIKNITQTITKMKGSEVNIKLENKAIDSIGGVIAYSIDGKKIHNNTIDARLIKIFNELKGSILNTLFGE